MLTKVNPPIDNSWMKTIRPVLDYFTIRTPGSWIEQKEANITWHYRNCPRSFGQLQAQEITNFISNITDYNIEVVRVHYGIEVRSRIPGIVTIIRQLFTGQSPFDFLLHVGEISDEYQRGTLRELVQVR